MDSNVMSYYYTSENSVMRLLWTAVNCLSLQRHLISNMKSLKVSCISITHDFVLSGGVQIYVSLVSIFKVVLCLGSSFETSYTYMYVPICNDL